VVEGIIVESDRKDKVLLLGNEDHCPLCPEKLQANVKYTDVLILSQFIGVDGAVLPQTVTGLCNKAQCRLVRLYQQAQRAGLMPEYELDPTTGTSKCIGRSNYKWKKYNAYFDE